jgi:hypothetical protein
VAVDTGFVPITGSEEMTGTVPATGSPRVVSMRRTTSNASNCNGFVGSTAGFGATSVFTAENTSVNRPTMALPGRAGATGVAAAGSTATAVCVTAVDGTTARCGATAAVTVETDPASAETRDTDARINESGSASSMALCALGTASALAWRPSGNDARSTDGLGSGDAAGSGDVEPGVEGAGDVVLDSAAAFGLVSPRLGDGPAAVFEPVVSAECLPAPFDDDERWVALVVREDVVDAAVGDSSDFCVEGDGALVVPADEVCGPALAAELVLPLDGEEAPGLSEPVPSAWATPDPLARAAPTPRVTAPAPNQPLATPCFGLARCRPFARRDLPPAAFFARFPPVTPAPHRT